MAVLNIRFKTSIRCDGKKYSDLAELPANVRAAYEKATAGGRPPLISNATSKILFNGREFSNEAEMPGRERRVYHDIISLIQDNGEVTLPGLRFSEALSTKRRIKFIFFLLGVIAFVVLVVLATAAP